LGIKVPKAVAWRRLEEALEWAKSDRPVPQDWEAFTQRTFEMKAMTYTPALATALLARATDDRIDPLAIKADYSDNSYSLRTLGHTVLVPAARAMHFSIRNSGREPLNNQPFFRYEHMTTIDRPRNKAGLADFISELRKLETLNQDEALAALAAFLRVALVEAEKSASYSVDENSLTVQRMVAVVEEYLSEPSDRPKRTQALVAAAFDVIYPEVRSRKINDPSRDYPGDVQVFNEDQPILSVEVRAKPVPRTEVIGFVEACRMAEIDRAFMVVLWSRHRGLPKEELRQEAFNNYGVLLTVIENSNDLLQDVFVWSELPLSEALSRFANSMLERLAEIGALDESSESWALKLGPMTLSQGAKEAGRKDEAESSQEGLF
jgi:hypothetical protein